MKIKDNKQKATFLDMFDVMDSTRKETNLSKILSYIISKNPYAFKKMVNTIIGQNKILKGKRADLLLKNSSIIIEKSYTNEQLAIKKGSGRTDIEIKIYNKNELQFFIIIECKVHKNKATNTQFEKYKNIFKLKENSNVNFKYFVYLSNQSGINLIGDNDVKQVDLNWRELINSLSEIKDTSHNFQADLNKFLNYYERSYGMSNQKEILIQDVGLSTEIDRYFNNIYRRKKVNGSPLYFAPYFTRNSKQQTEGITHISKILGIITTNDISWEKVKDNCEKFIELYDKNCKHKIELLRKWEDGLNGDAEFLSNPELQKKSYLNYLILNKINSKIIKKANILNRRKI